jgi:hypothetical protein
LTHFVTGGAVCAHSRIYERHLLSVRSWSITEQINKSILTLFILPPHRDVSAVSFVASEVISLSPCIVIQAYMYVVKVLYALIRVLG